jgi:ABC-type glycerol-3-phosphate transport system substrate-binding protein
MNEIPGRISRRALLGSAAGLLAGSALAACGGSGGGSGGSGTLEVLTAEWGALYDAALQKIGDSYTADNPDTKVHWTFTKDWQTKLLTQTAGNNPPDASYTNYSAQASLASGGEFLPLDDYLSAAGLKRDDFISSMWDASEWDGKLYCLPGGSDWITLFWSKDVYKAAGLDPEKPPTTADELIEHSKQLLQKDSSGNIKRVGYVPAAGDFIQWAFIFGGSFYDPEKKKTTAADPANIDALQWMYDYTKLLDVNKITSFTQQPTYSQAGSPFATNQQALMFGGFWTYDALDKYAPKIQYGVTYWPTKEGKADERKNYLLQGWMFGIPKGVKDPAKSWDFLKYAFIDNSAKMGYQTLNGPCLLSALPDFLTGLKAEIGADNRMSPYLSVFTDTAAAGTKYWPVMNQNSYYYDQVTSVYDFVMRGKMTPKAALEQVDANVQKKVDGK